MSDTGRNLEFVGRKIFFLFPTVVVQNRIITELVQQEYEVYIAKNKDSIKKVLSKHPDSILFIDINEHMPESEWELWIKGVMEASDTKNISIGIVSANDDEAIKAKYLSTIKVPCGYIPLKFELEKATNQILDILHKVNAKGRRKYVRATIEGESNATLNMPWHGDFLNGQIKDISVVGISCTLESNPEIPKNALCKDIQIKLQSSLLKVDGIVLGSRNDGMQNVYVILFTQRVDPEARVKIRKFIQQNLQSKMEFDLR